MTPKEKYNLLLTAVEDLIGRYTFARNPLCETDLIAIPRHDGRVVNDPGGCMGSLHRLRAAMLEVTKPDEREFPVLNSFRGIKLSIPWKVIVPHEAQAVANHGQTLEQLAKRGGLSPCEIVAVLEDRPWKYMTHANSLAIMESLAGLSTRSR